MAHFADRSSTRKATVAPWDRAPAPPAELPATTATESVRTYFTAADGTEYRVYDAVLRDGKYRAIALATPGAQYRVFVTEDGTRRAYQFHAYEVHDLEPSVVGRQLSEARSA